MKPCKRRPPVVLAVLLLTLLLAAALEIVSYGLWWWVRGEPFSYAAAGALRAARELPAGRTADREDGAQRTREHAQSRPPTVEEVLQEVTVGVQMLHPYLGYVTHPEAARIPRRGPELPVGPFGFYHLRDERVPAAVRFADRGEDSRDELRIGVFGGSVAFVFSLAGREALVRELRRRGAVPPGARIEVVSRALGGYKQPQQVLTLAYLLSLGEDLDVVVNLDGFNEVVLAMLVNARNGVFPAYPQRWPRRVEPVPDPGLQRRVGEVAFLERRRAELARRFDAGFFAATVTGNLLWLVADRRAGAELAAAQRRLAAAQGKVGVGHRALADGPRFSGGDEAVLDAMVDLWARASRQMHDLCVARGIAYHHVLQPNQYVPGSKPLSRWEESNARRPDHPYRPWVERGYPKLRAAGRELAASGVAFHDLTELFAEERETVYADDCCHLNAHGNQMLAEAVAAALTGVAR